MEIKITTSDKEFSPEDLEDMNDIVIEAKELLEGFNRDMQNLQDDFTSYGEISFGCHGDGADDGDDLAEKIRKRVAGHTVSDPSFVSGKNPNGIKFAIFTEKGTELRPTEMVRGNNEGKIALMWPSGGFLHNDPQTNDDSLQRLYSEANVPVDKRAAWKPAWRKSSF